MKIVNIGDTHGRVVWKEIVERNQESTFIFSGDYIDPYTDIEGITQEEAIENLKDIIEFKKNNMDTVILLKGNHDTQYMYYPKFGLSTAFDYKFKDEIINLFHTNIDLFQFAYQVDNYVFTHAGISTKWLDYHIDIFNEFGLKDDYSNIANIINEIGESIYLTKVIDNISYLRCGPYLYGSIIWADAREFVDGGNLPNITQVVGHTKVKDFFTLDGDGSSITFIDCLFDKIKEYIINI